MAKSKRDRIAQAITLKRGGERSPRQGADVVNEREAIAIETNPSHLTIAIARLNGYPKRRYIAVPNELVKQAADRTRRLKVGVMDEEGNIRKRAG